MLGCLRHRDGDRIILMAREFYSDRFIESIITGSPSGTRWLKYMLVEPRPLFKVIEKDHAIDLVKNGRIYLHPLKAYQDIENEASRDPTEGKFSFNTDGLVGEGQPVSPTLSGFISFGQGVLPHGGNFRGNEFHHQSRFFAVCLTDNPKDLYSKNHFKHKEPAIVRLIDPRAFAEGIRAQLTSQVNDIGCDGYVRIDYDKESMGGGAGQSASVISAYTKPRSFENEQEWRICFYGDQQKEPEPIFLTHQLIKRSFELVDPASLK